MEIISYDDRGIICNLGGGAGGAARGRGRGRGRGARDNSLIGQTVRIAQGPFKGENFKYFLF